MELAKNMIHLAEIGEKDAGKFFGKYKKKEVKEKKLVFAKSAIVSQIMYNFEEFLEEQMGCIYDPHDILGIAEKFVTPLDYKKEDVEKFCLNMEEATPHFQFAQRSGVYLTALIKRLAKTEQDFKLNFMALHMPPGNVGMELENITLNIIGDCGATVGMKSRNLTVIVDGNVGDHACQNAIKPNLKIKGNAGNYLFDAVKDGAAVIRGNAGSNVANHAHYSKVSVHGDVGSRMGFLAENCKIFVNGCAGGELGCEAKQTEISVEGGVTDKGLVGNGAKECLIKVMGMGGTLGHPTGLETKIYLKGRLAYPKLKHHILHKGLEVAESAVESFIDWLERSRK